MILVNRLLSPFYRFALHAVKESAYMYVKVLFSKSNYFQCLYGICVEYFFGFLSNGLKPED